MRIKSWFLKEKLSKKERVERVSQLLMSEIAVRCGVEAEATDEGWSNEGVCQFMRAVRDKIDQAIKVRS